MLFEMPKKNDTAKTNPGKSAEIHASHHFPVSSKLEDMLQLLKDGRCIHWLSEGDWNMHDMLAGLLNFTGPADVYISSYAFTEFPARLIADLNANQIIKKLYCIIDKRIDVRSASALNILRTVATRLELVNTHAKVTVIENKKHMIAVVGSANYTTNRRYESGVIIADREAAGFHKKWIEDALSSHQ